MSVETGKAPEILSHFPPPYSPRPEQTKAILAVKREFDAGKSIVALQGPTGIGKTFIGMTHARYLQGIGQKTHVLTVQKILQSQYTADFPPPQIEVLKGRSNYRCGYGPTSDRDASRGHCRSSKKTSIIQECLNFGTPQEAVRFTLPPEAHACDYWAQLTRAMESPITLFNFHSFLFQQRLGRFGKRDFMILDECHQTESVLLQFVEISLSDKVLRQLGIRIDLTLKTPEDVLAWIEKNLVVEKAVKTLGGAAFTEEVADGLSPQETDRLKTLLDRVETLKKYFDMTEWVVDVTEEIDFDDPKEKIRTLRIRPVFVSLFARELIFSKAEKVLAMSATILDPKIWARNLGLSFDKLGYVEAPCTFPVKNRPIFLEYAGNMGWKTFDETLPKLYQGIVSIMNRHQGQRGIIHAHSEKLVRLITKNINTSRFLHLDMFPNRDKTALLAEHLKRKDSIIVGSAFHEGIDLKDDLARFQMIAKTPWPSTGDPLVKKRMELDGSFLPYQAALKFIQSAGRCVRHEKDWASTYVLDSGFERLLASAGRLFPKWFTDAIQRSPKNP